MKLGRRSRQQRSAADDGLEDAGSDVRIIPLDAPDEPDELDEQDDVDDGVDNADEVDDGEANSAVPGDALLDELSEAFGDSPDTLPDTPPDAPSGRTTIAIGGDDELPDAVYLDDELGRDDDSGTVFIDDDGQTDAIPTHDASGKGIDPRLRQRRIGVRRAEGRRRLRWVALAVVVVALVVGGLAALGSSLFAVEQVEVIGRTYADPEVVDEVVEDLEGTPVLLVDADDIEQRLEAIPWVESARVTTRFPDSATIELRERTPVATVRGVDGRFRVLDSDGRVLDVIDGQPIAFVLITGPGTVDLAPGEFADTGYAAAASLVTKLTPGVRSRLESMSATADGSDIRLVLRSELPTGGPGRDVEVLLGAAIGDNDQIEKLVRLERILDDVDGSDTTVINVSTAEATEL